MPTRKLFRIESAFRKGCERTLRVANAMHIHSAKLLASILFAYILVLVCNVSPSFAQRAVVPGKGTPQFQSAVIPFSFEDNRIFVRTIINGQGPFSFVVDTGSGDLTVDSAVARRLRLRPKPAGSTGGAGSRAVTFSTGVVASIQVGAARADNQPATVLDLSQIRGGIGFPCL